MVWAGLLFVLAAAPPRAPRAPRAPLQAEGDSGRERGQRRRQQRVARLAQAATNRSVFSLASAALALSEDERVSEVKGLEARDIGSDASLRGRRAADAAFRFARAGVADGRLFSALEARFVGEMDRVAATGDRSGLFVVKEDDVYPDDSRDDALDVGASDGLDACRVCLHSFERLRASGCGGDDAARAAGRAMEALLPADETATDCARAAALRAAARDLGRDDDDDTRPKLWLWRRENRARKARRFFRGPAAAPRALPPPPAWRDLFADCSRPLSLDLGCGLGLAGLGLASADPHVNVLGVDASPSLVAHAAARAARAGLADRAAFAVSDALAAAEAAREYPGPVAEIAVRFPTPFREGRGGALEAVPGARSDSWLVTRRLCDAVNEALGDGDFIVVSQVAACAEEAARVAAAAGLVEAPTPRPTPRGARTETECMCAALGKPVYRKRFRKPTCS